MKLGQFFLSYVLVLSLLFAGLDHAQYTEGIEIHIYEQLTSRNVSDDRLQLREP